ncbi:hypothetical protein V5799_003164 [Amblyomma americanum]|uniref:Uncharacterized protein n=1 Tax=Amblyomma americanum TaxID=6943 RepID=A0AAQ4D9R4_AMBAM
MLLFQLAPSHVMQSTNRPAFSARTVVSKMIFACVGAFTLPFEAKTPRICVHFPAESGGVGRAPVSKLCLVKSDEEEMSDDEDIAYIKRQKVVHYGSLEEKERQRLAEKDPAVENGSDEDSQSMDLKAAMASGNIHISDEYMDIEDEGGRDKQQLLEEFERRKKARQINVSTDDTEVKSTLREMGEPICTRSFKGNPFPCYFPTS